MSTFLDDYFEYNKDNSYVMEVSINKKKLEDPEYIDKLIKKINTQSKIESNINQVISFIGMVASLTALFTIIGFPICILILKILEKIEYGPEVTERNLNKLYNEIGKVIKQAENNNIDKSYINRLKENQNKIFEDKKYYTIADEYSKEYSEKGYLYNGIYIPCFVSDFLKAGPKRYNSLIDKTYDSIVKDKFKYNDHIENLYNTMTDIYRTSNSIQDYYKSEIYNDKNQQYADIISSGDIEDGFVIRLSYKDNKIEIIRENRKIKITLSQFEDLYSKLYFDMFNIFKKVGKGNNNLLLKNTKFSKMSNIKFIDITNEFCDDIFESGLFDIFD